MISNDSSSLGSNAKESEETSKEGKNKQSHTVLHNDTPDDKFFIINLLILLPFLFFLLYLIMGLCYLTFKGFFPWNI